MIATVTALTTSKVCEISGISFWRTPLAQYLSLPRGKQFALPKICMRTTDPLPQDTCISRFIAFINAQVTAVSVGLTNEQQKKKMKQIYNEDDITTYREKRWQAEGQITKKCSSSSKSRLARYGWGERRGLQCEKWDGWRWTEFSNVNTKERDVLKCDFLSKFSKQI